ncbi:ABC-2 type transport system permease protein [Paenibacillus castaneae]|uniref:ABC transporter permease n=1 Tax=Paenibacillus castaneae TaxID=474957 RepID=UPI00141BE300|nr:ABC transporter permease subunit [Paenibacillus castaneae]NIK76797.1 ABC-2 type transport system permease protein [Paenibacillus castaneae]
MIYELVKKETKEHIFSRKGIGFLFIVSILLSIMSFGFISVKELSLLDQPSIVMTTFKLLLGINILISMVIGSTMVAGEKEKGTLESLLLTPLTKRKIIIGKLIAILVFWLTVTLISLPYFIVLSNGTSMLPTILFYLYVVGTVLVISFSSIALIFSTILASTKNAMIVGLMIFLITLVPMFLSTTMKKAGFAKLIQSYSPISASMKTMKDLFINKLGALDILVGMVPVFVFFVLALSVSLLISKKVDFLGGE